MTRAQGLVPTNTISAKPMTPEDLIGYKVCHPDQIVMNRMQAWSGMFAVASETGIVSPDYAVFSVRSDVAAPSFLVRLLKSPAMVDEFVLASRGIGSGFNRLYTDKLGAISVLLPDQEEQQAIARFLDRQNRRIDRFIRAKRKLIALLNEQKQAIIHQAVTRGLDPDVPLKPSGIPWLGDIPAHWEVMKMPHLFRYMKGRRAAQLTREYVGAHPGPYPVYSGQTEQDGLMGQIDWFEFDFGEPIIFVTTVGARAMTTRLVAGKFNLSQNCALITPRSNKSLMAFYEPLVQVMFSYERAKISLIMQPSLRFADLDRFSVPVPPVSEQRDIAQSLAESTSAIEASIRRTQREIGLIQEYRIRLISDAVTGQIDVLNHPDAGEHSPDDNLIDETLGAGDDAWDVDTLAIEEGDIDGIP